MVASPIATILDRIAECTGMGPRLLASVSLDLYAEGAELHHVHHRELVLTTQQVTLAQMRQGAHERFSCRSCWGTTYVERWLSRTRSCDPHGTSSLGVFAWAAEVSRISANLSGAVENAVVADLAAIVRSSELYRTKCEVPETHPLLGNAVEALDRRLGALRQRLSASCTSKEIETWARGVLRLGPHEGDQTPCVLVIAAIEPLGPMPSQVLSRYQVSTSHGDGRAAIMPRFVADAILVARSPYLVDIPMATYPASDPPAVLEIATCLWAPEDPESPLRYFADALSVARAAAGSQEIEAVEPAMP